MVVWTVGGVVLNEGLVVVFVGFDVVLVGFVVILPGFVVVLGGLVVVVLIGLGVVVGGRYPLLQQFVSPLYISHCGKHWLLLAAFLHS